MGNVGRARSLSAGFVALFAVAGCEQSTSTEPSGNLHVHSALTATSPVGDAGSALVREVHAAVARFHSAKQAEKAGYLSDPHCVEAPPGGMGHHWVNPELVDPAFDATRPEALLYAPDRNGKLKLVGVEYIVINTGQARPSFEGHLFDVGGAPIPAAHWTLHVWVTEPNPSGLFAPFNPNVDCP